MKRHTRHAGPPGRAATLLLVLVAALLGFAGIWMLLAAEDASGAATTAATTAASEPSAGVSATTAGEGERHGSAREELVESLTGATTLDAATGGAQAAHGEVIAEPPGNEVVFTGRVVDAAGRGLGGASVWHYPTPAQRTALGLPPWARREGVDWDELNSVQTDRDGHFTLVTRDGVPDRPKASRGFARTTAQTPLLVVAAPAARILVETLVAYEGVDLDVGELVVPAASWIEGRVVDELGAPVAGAEISAFEQSYGPSRPENHDLARWLMTTKSAADGRFRLDSLWPGEATYLVTRDGFTPLFVPLVLPESDGLDAGDLRLSRGGAIRGQVIDADGAPLEGVSVVGRVTEMHAPLSGLDTVYAETHMLIWTSGYRPSKAVTDAHGAFALTGLDRDGYVVLFTLDGYEPARLRGVAVGTGLPPQVLQREATALVEVVDYETGERVAGVTATGRRRIGKTPGDWDWPVAVLVGAEAAAAAGESGPSDGLVLLRHIGPAFNDVVVSAEGYASDGFVVKGVPAPETTRRTVRLRRESSLSGRVVDLGGHGVPDATVLLTAPPTLRVGQKGREVVTDEDGRYTLAGLREGSWVLGVSADGFLPAEEREVGIAHSKARELDDLVLRRGGAITGTVLDEHGVAVVGFFVTATPGDPDHVQRVRARTDATGRFEMPGLEAGSWTLTAASGCEAAVELLVGGEVDVTLHQRPPSSVRGRVVDAAGEPIAGAKVLLHDGSEPFRFDDNAIVTDALGAFELIGGAGEYVVEARTDTGRTETPAFMLEWGEQRLVDLAFSALSLEGVVRDAMTGVALEGISVWTSGAGSARTTNAAGRFRFDGLSAGEYTLSGGNADYVRGTVGPVVLAADSVAPEVVLELQRGARVHGEVHDLGGKTLVAGLRVVVSQQQGSRNGNGTMLKQGAYSVSPLAAGRYWVGVWRSGLSFGGLEQEPPLAEQEIEIGVGEERRLDFDIDDPDG